MTLHDRLKPVPAEEPPPTRGWHAVVVGVVLAVFAAGFAVAMPLAMRPEGRSGERSPPGTAPLASPSSHPAAVTLPSPAAPARPEDDAEVASDPEPGVDLGVDRAESSRPTTKNREVAKPRTVRPPQPAPDDKHRKRAPDDPGDHDKGYGNDPGGPHKATPDGKRSGGKKGKKR